jgi:hypothetical protein
MGIRSLLAKPFASFVVKDIKKWSSTPVETQFKVFDYLLDNLKKTAFGKDKGLVNISTYEEFKTKVPIQDYEGFIPYISQIKKGDLNVLWPGRPLYFAKTSGTTSGIKYIPLTKESVPYHINSARNAILCYVHETGKAQFLDKKLIFLSGSPELDKAGVVPYGRLSGIASDMVPAYLRSNQMPSYATNCMEDWEDKLEKIIDETIDKNMSLISGIPPWVQMYFDRIQARTGKKIKDVFPDFELFIYGGVNFEPYKAKLFESIGKSIPSIETYPASEGFIAYQDSQKEKGLLLLLDNGMFYEFIPADEYHNENPTRLHIGQVELGKNYAIILNTNAGLWGYSIGDTVKFVSTNPYRIVVTGRIKHFISAFGEHVIGEEVEKAMKNTMSKFPEAELVEFTVAPQVTPAEGLPYHEWLIEFTHLPTDLRAFNETLDSEMVKQNTYYNDLITGNILRTLKLTTLPKGAFIDYMKSIGKLGGQNKVPRLANDRKVADALLNL